MSEQITIHVDNKEETLNGVAGNIIALAVDKILKGAGIVKGVKTVWTDLLLIAPDFNSKILTSKDVSDSLDKCKTCHKCEQSSDLWIFDSKKEYTKFLGAMSGWVRFKLINNIESAGVGELVVDRKNQCFVSPTSLSKVYSVVEGKTPEYSIYKSFLVGAIYGEVDV